MTPGLALILAAAGQFVIVLALGARLFRARSRALRDGAVKLADVAITQDAYPDDARKLQANLNNQFETPTLFLAAIAVALAAGLAGWTLAALAWIWLAARVAHMSEHTGRNHVLRRAKIFGAGLAVLALMWLALVTAALF